MPEKSFGYKYIFHIASLSALGPTPRAAPKAFSSLDRIARNYKE
jgi:hypothetical protein